MVDRAGRVEAGDAVLEREARARPDLDFIAFGNGDGETGRDRVALAGRKRQILGRDDIEPGRAVGRVGRRRQALRRAAAAAARSRSLRLLPRRLAAALLLGRPLGGALVDQAHGFVQRHRLGSAPLGKVAWVVPSLT